MLIYSFSNDTVNALRTAYEILEKPIKVRSDHLNAILSVAEQLVAQLDK